ncbi:uncharacterized protein LOC123273621 isoform X2 [Cotesia glomerata]|uniref:uncharacterized protein LOC123273621 isoform X2 n=1 Tax=Cotesia glomerata TaxID=32391 RepID=UPI001D00EDFD|nr:uncharacterized protein LOC123273621 isoform X2 [Cotesia glomerata]
MSESDKALLDDNDSKEMFEHVEQDSGNTEKDPALQIKTEKTEDTLHSLSQFRKGLMQQTNGNNPESSTKSSDIKDVKVSLERMKHFSTPVKPGQSMNDGKNDSKDDGADDDFKDKSEQTKIKIRSSEKMLMLGNKNLEDMKRLMLESNKQTQEMAASIGKTARRLEEVSIAMLDALKVMTKGYQSELDREKIKAEATKLEAEKKTGDGDDTVKAQIAKFDSKTRCYRCAKTGHRIEDCLLSKDLWFCYFCQDIKNHKGAECKEGRLKSKILNNDNIKSRGKVDRRGFIKVRNNVNSKPYNNDRRFKNCNKNNQQSAQNAPKRDSRSAKRVTDERQGKKLLNEDLIDEIKFIADSGATDHIVKNRLILSNFEKCENKVIKSANKNKSADILIDGKGDLLLYTNQDNKIIKLSNVISAKDVSDNLLSLRKLVDKGFKIYLDDKTLRVFSENLEEIILEGIYEQPNWILNFKVKNYIDDKNKLDWEYNTYRCKAVMIQEDDTDESEVDLQRKEGDSENIEVKDSSIRREEEVTTPPEIEQHPENPDDDMFNWDSSLITRNTIKLDDIESIKNLEELFTSNPLEQGTTESSKINEAMLWHVRLGHASLNYLKKLQKVYSKLEKVRFDDSILDCEICIMSKMQKLPFKEVRRRASRPLQIIHTVTMGPIKPTSHPGHKRFINVYIDDYSRLARAYPVKTKDESGETLEKFLISTRNLLGKDEKVCYVRSDQGTEFTGGKFLEVLRKEKIELELTPPYTPEHNGVSERFNATLQRKVRTYMLDSGLPKSMWELAVDAAVHSYNRTPHKSIDYDVPLMKFNKNENCHFDKIKRFGCIGYIRIPKPEHKFSERAIKAVMVGYKPTGYLLWHPSTGKFLESRHIRFNEKLVYKDVYKNKQTEETEDEISWKSDENVPNNLEDKINEEKEKPEQRKRGRPRKNPLDVKNLIEKKNSSEEIRPCTRGEMKRKLESGKDKLIEDISFAKSVNVSEDQSKMDEQELIRCLITSLNKEPINYDEASNSSERCQWMKAIKDELDSITKNDVWEFVDLKEASKIKGKLNIIDSR